MSARPRSSSCARSSPQLRRIDDQPVPWRTVATTLDAPTAAAADGITPSPAGTLTDTTAPPLLPPALGLPALLQTIRFGLRPFGFNFSAQRQLGEIFRVNLLSREDH